MDTTNLNQNKSIFHNMHNLQTEHQQVKQCRDTAIAFSLSLDINNIRDMVL